MFLSSNGQKYRLYLHRNVNALLRIDIILAVNLFNLHIIMVIRKYMYAIRTKDSQEKKNSKVTQNMNT